MNYRILFVGDLRLGRRAACLPTVLSDRGFRAEELGPTAAWKSTVRWAVQNRIDAVVLAGNVVESADDLFEAYGDLAQGVRQLEEAGIRVLGVAGANDVATLPQLADRQPAFRLLGRGGQWESEVLEGAQGKKVRLLGWSFPSQQVAFDPFQNFPKVAHDEVPTLGVLSCDLDGPKGSTRAPVFRDSFPSSALDGWFLSQRPQPDALSAPRPFGYLGAAVPVEPGETGLHGPWLVTVHGKGEVEVRQEPLAPMRWEDLPLAVDEIDGGDADLEARLRAGLREAVQRVLPEKGQVRAVGCCVRLTGSSVRHRQIVAALREDRLFSMYEERDGVPFFLQSIEDESMADLDLQQIAQSSDPPGLLARRILMLQDGGPSAEALVAEASQRMEGVVHNALWSGLQEDESELDVQQLLIQSGMEVLEELIAQRDEAPLEVKQ